MNTNIIKEYLTTTQAAKICRVTRFTIANWVKEGKLKSRKTAGGHRRILRSNLLRFIKKNNIAGIEEKEAAWAMPLCWEFKGFKNSDKHNCRNCLVFKEKANKCFLVVSEFGSEKIQCRDDCVTCKYLITYYSHKKKIIEKIRMDKGYWHRGSI